MLRLSHPGHQKELKPEPLFFGAGLEQLVQFLPLVHLWLFFGVAGPIIFADQAANPVRPQKCHDRFKLVVERRVEPVAVDEFRRSVCRPYCG